MAIKGTLSIDGTSQVFTLQECEYRLSQQTNVDGVPSAGVCGGLIIATVITPTKGFTLYEWMLNDFMKKDGTISFITNFNVKTLLASRTIRFEEAICTDLFEYFNGNDNTMMTTRLSIYARKIMFGDVSGQCIGLDNYSKQLIEGQMSATDNIKEKLKLAKEAALGQAGRLF